VIAQKLRPDDPDAAAAPAAREALRQRGEALANGESFSIETTLSGKSEQRLIDDARAVGYRVTMTYVALDSSDRNVDRVNLRAEEERRSVPAADVRRRYERSLDALRDSARRIDRIHVFDNSEKISSISPR
jgi:predicted ABC-type ATPase